ncbi:zinc finger CCCH domain-containing protein 30-like [Olea europaea var. sylvestris]|uniref:zinc finger CCCH domain-containing protein 30-like n=1 Tax=Olea europaea var. sylvestris TaxID=158386 RepID=UPI000C1D733C|nr:zinc finger CCCH domain-containing protein 30-like [Olea europaea var. sylvestris]XP_022842216.1 zinc finger CCCH domain-containing protein 30-like [Olea europaea var. sylvestris]
MNVSPLNVETEDAFASLLELAANNDIEGFKRLVDREPLCINEVGFWYGRQKGSKQMVFHQRTPLMVAATYGSLDVLKLIISSPEVDVNQSSGVDKCTALHCAASGGSVDGVDVVKLLLAAGANPNLADANGCCPFDVINVPPKFQEMRISLETILRNDATFEELNLRASATVPNSDSPPLSPSPHIGSPSSPSELVACPNSAKFASEKKEYPSDPSLPDIKNSIYATDEFRMFSFKVRPCSRAYSHDWTECPFVHPGENARRRDPRKYHYSCVPCPDFRKGACRRGDMCEYAHGVFECWLHPAQYRTRLCKDGTSCNRRVCFFAHTQEELRPLYVSTGSAVLSPRSTSSAANAMDFAAAMSLLPGSPSSPFAPPMSPSTDGMSNMGWSPQNVPSLHLPGSNLQSSRLRTSLNARDFPPEDLSLLQDFDVQQQQFLNELSRLSQPSANANSLNHSARSKTLIPSNLEDAFSVDNSSPRYTDPSVFSPTHKSALLNQFQQQQQNIQSPVDPPFSPRNIDHALLQTSFGVPSSGRMSPRSMEHMSSMNSRVSMLAQCEKHQKQFRSLSSRDLGSNAVAAVASSEDAWSSWGSSTGKPDWAVNADEFGKLKRSSSFETLNGAEEPDTSWVQSLVKESPQETKEKSASRVLCTAGLVTSSSENANLDSQIEHIDQSTALGALLEQMKLDQLMAQ